MEDTGQAGDPGRNEYRIGDSIYTVRSFKGSKGVRAFGIISRILREKFRPVWEADARFQRDYRELSALKITRGLAHYRVEQANAAIAGLEAEAEAHTAKRDEPGEQSLEDHQQEIDERIEAIGHLIRVQEINRDQWQRLLEGALAEVEEIQVPRDPDSQARFAHAFPLLWDVAEDEMTMLLGLALIPDEDLKAARQEGGSEAAETAIRDLGLEALDYLEMDEIAGLMLSVAEVAVERAGGVGGDLGKRWATLQERLWPSRTEEEAETPNLKEEPTVGTFVGHEEEPPSGSENSSTDSPADTTGPPSESSLANSGATS